MSSPPLGELQFAAVVDVSSMTRPLNQQMEFKSCRSIPAAPARPHTDVAARAARLPGWLGPPRRAEISTLTWTGH